MDSDRFEDSGEMYSPDEQGEYMPLDGNPRFSVQGLLMHWLTLGKGSMNPQHRNTP